MGLLNFLATLIKPNGHAAYASEASNKVENPATNFEAPADIVTDKELSHDHKKQALDTWEQDARQLMTASNEGMPGCEEGSNPADHHRLGEVVRAKDKLGEKPALKTAHY